MVEITSMCQGSRIGYAHPRSLTSSSPFIHPDKPEGSDLLALRPTLMAAVPAILDLIKNGLSMKTSKMEGFKGKLVRGAIRKAMGKPAGEGFSSSLLLSMGMTGVLLKKVKQQLGLENLR